MPIQGTAADIIKFAMIRVSDRLAAEGLQARLILQVHDELIVEAPGRRGGAGRRVAEGRDGSRRRLKVKLAVDVHTGATWYDAKG